MTLHKVDLWTKFSVVTMQMKFLHRNLPVAQFVFLNNIFENGSDIFNNFFFTRAKELMAFLTTSVGF